MPWIRRRRQDARDPCEGGPERQQKAGHERVPDDGIQPTGLESPDAFRGTGRRPARLTQPGQLEVVDGVGGPRRQGPAGRAQTPQHEGGWARDLPDLPVDGLPQEHQQDQADLGGEEIDGALERHRYHAAHRALDASTGHDRVLDAEHEQEAHVGEQCDDWVSAHPSVDGPRAGHVGEESRRPQHDRVEADPRYGGEGKGAGSALHPIQRAGSAPSPQAGNYRTSRRLSTPRGDALFTVR